MPLRHTLLISMAAAMLCTTLAAQEARKTAEATWPAGKVLVSYGSPTWRPNFKSEIKEGFVWRLGNDDATSLSTTCGLDSASGPIPPGEYKLALRCLTPDTWHLLVYQGDGLYSEGLRTWEIAPSAMVISEARISDNLSLTFGDSQTLNVDFGPYAVVYPLNPIPVHSPVETEFARIPTRVEVMALPLREGALKDVCIGNASVMTGGSKLTWEMKLTVDGEKATLTFTNGRAATIAKEKAQIAQRLERLQGFLESSPDQKERIEKMMADAKEQTAKLEGEAALLARYQATRTVEGTLNPREEPATQLDFSHERPQGSLVLKFGAGEKNAVFDVNPRTFMVRRQDG